MDAKSPMIKKIVLMLGYLFLALIVAAAAGFLFLVFEGKRLDKESKVFADATVLAIAKDWDANELRKRASAEFENAVDYDEIQEYFDSLGSLGKFISSQGAVGESTITLSAHYGYEITADYTCILQFQAGSAEVQIVLIKLEGRWQVLDFKVTPQEYSEDQYVVW